MTEWLGDWRDPVLGPAPGDAADSSGGGDEAAGLVRLAVAAALAGAVVRHPVMVMATVGTEAVVLRMVVLHIGMVAEVPSLHLAVVHPVAPTARLKWRLNAFASWNWTRRHARQPQQTITKLFLVWRLSMAAMVTGVGRWLRRDRQCQDWQVMVWTGPLMTKSVPVRLPSRTAVCFL